MNDSKFLYETTTDKRGKREFFSKGKILLSIGVETKTQ